MDAKFIAQCKAEYYESLAEHPALHDMLNRHGGLILARVGGHPPWPARFSEPGEFTKMVRHRQKKGYLCVYFFGSRNFGWVHHNAIMPFSDDYTSIKASKKYTSTMVQRAIDALSEAGPILHDAEADNSLRFYDRIMENKYEAVDMPCEVCNRVDDHYSNLILCDGKDCKREYHMNCLTPPLEEVPPGDWFCPECIKESTRQLKLPVTSPASHMSNTISRTIDMTEQDSLKTQKKEKSKPTKTGSHKRKLPTTANMEAEQEGIDSKKIRQQSCTVDILRSSPSKHFTSNPLGDNDHEYSDVESEERCLICGYGGEVVVCEFYGCTKVYHQFCLGTFHFPKDDDVTWFCPRHRCAQSGSLEMVNEMEQTPTTGKGAGKVSVKMQLWKCTQCPVALNDGVMPSIPKSQIFSTKKKSFLCAYCSSNCPLKVQLAKALEKTWAFIATNHQALPFCGPLLSGLDRPSTCRVDIGQLDLFRILAKVRRLEYENSMSFVNDIKTVVSDALEIIEDRSQPLTEAARTMEIMCMEQMTMHHLKFEQLENKIVSLRAQNKAESLLVEGIIGYYHASDRKKWPLRWRQECGLFDDKWYPTVDARSLADWTAYVTVAPMYVSLDELERAGRINVAISPSERSTEICVTQNKVDHRCDKIDPLKSGQSDVPAFPGLTLSEGTDVMMALTQLSRREEVDKRTTSSNLERVCGWHERDLEENSSGEYFLSPSISEMQQMFGQQSELLRRALESHSVLQKAWLVNKQKILKVSDEFSVAEGRLAAELRLANKNLRARLRNKDKLVSELTDENVSLRVEVKQLQKALAEAKSTDSTTRKVSVSTTENGESEIISSAESTSSGRKSPRTNKAKVATQVKTTVTPPVPARRGRPPKKATVNTQ